MSKIGEGGHLFVLSDKAADTVRFRATDEARRAELAFAASFFSGRDLEALEEEKLPLGVRAMPGALADFAADVPRTRAMLDELYDGDLTLANLYLRAIIEEVPVPKVGEILRTDMFDKLRELESFRVYEAKVRAEIAAEVKAEADAKIAAEIEARFRAEADAKVAAADAKAAAAQMQAAEAEVATTAGNLKDLLILRGDEPSEYALNTIDACRSAVKLDAWLKRAFRGETSAQLFPEPEPPAS